MSGVTPTENSRWIYSITRLKKFTIIKKITGKNALQADALRGISFSLFSFFIQKGLHLCSNLILTRLLFPEAFGLMALASVFITGLAMISELGIKQSVVQHRNGADYVFLNTAWTLKVIRGFCIAIITCIIAWPSAQIYGEPLLFPILCTLSTTAILQGFGSITIATQSRKMHFSRVVAMELLQSMVTIAVTLVAAYWLKSVWALVIGTVTGNVAHLILSHYLLPFHRHQLQWDKRCGREIVRFGRWILLATLVNFIGRQGLPLIQGLMVSTEVLGLLAIATTLAEVPQALSLKLVNTVAFPAFSKLTRDNPERVPEVIAKVRLVSNGIAVGAFLLLSFLSVPLVNLLYEERYARAGSFLSIIAINGAVGFLQMLYQSVQIARGESRKHFYVTFTMAVSRTLGMTVGFELGGVTGMLYGLCLGSMPGYLVSVFMAYRGGFATVKADFICLAAIGLCAIHRFL